MGLWQLLHHLVTLLKEELLESCLLIHESLDVNCTLVDSRALVEVETGWDLGAAWLEWAN